MYGLTRQRPSVKSAVGVSVLLIVLLAFPVWAQERTLTFMHCWDAHRTAWVDEMLDSFEAAHPGVKVERQLVVCGMLRDNFMTAYLGGAAPDVVMIHSLDIPALVESGVFVPLDDYLKADGISMDTWYPSEIGTAVWQDRLYGLPIRTGGDTNSVFYYNRTLFAEVGLNPDDPPATWDEWLEAAQRLTRYEEDRLVRAGTALYGGDFSEVAYLATAGGRLISEDGRCVAFTDEAGIAAAQFTYDLGARTYRGHWHELYELTGGDDTAAFLDGRLAMHTGGILSHSFYVTNAPELDFAIAVRPSREPGGPSGANAGTFHWAIARGSSDEALAWELVKWVALREDTGGLFMLRQGRPSPVRAFNDNPAYFETNPYWLVVGEALARAVTLPSYPFTRDVMNIFGGAVGSVAWGDQAAVPALEQAAAQAQALIDEYWQGR